MPETKTRATVRRVTEARDNCRRAIDRLNRFIDECGNPLFGKEAEASEAFTAYEKARDASNAERAELQARLADLRGTPGVLAGLEAEALASQMRGAGIPLTSDAAAR